jgi:hypothetical protein
MASTGALASDTTKPLDWFRVWSRGHGQGHWRAPQALAKEVQRRPAVLPADPPHRHQLRLRPRPDPGPAATTDFAQDPMLIASRRALETLLDRSDLDCRDILRHRPDPRRGNSRRIRLQKVVALGLVRR